jgi:DNA-binding response OmpR family regulator
MPSSAVLIADDHEVARTLLVHAVRAAGFETIAVGDGGAALEAAHQQQPAVLLLDVHMPVMDGFEVLRRLKRENLAPQTAVIMLTASGMPQEIVDALDLGATDYVTKPFNPAELVARVRRAMRARPDAANPSAEGATAPLRAWS